MNSRISGHVDTRFASPVPQIRGGGRIRTTATPDAPRRRPAVSPRSPATPLPFLRLDFALANLEAPDTVPGTPPTPDARRIPLVTPVAPLQHQHEDDDENDHTPIPSPPRNVRVRINLADARTRRSLNFDNV
jgi:hypothetical protein